MARVARDALVRNWTRAPEDDSEGCLVYRPADAELPPARMPRSGLELAPDGALRELTPGPSDKREPTDGSWELSGEELTLRVGGGPPRRYGVERADAHELRLRQLD